MSSGAAQYRDYLGIEPGHIDQANAPEPGYEPDSDPKTDVNPAAADEKPAPWPTTPPVDEDPLDDDEPVDVDGDDED